jgi:hypothetical protein
VPELVFRLHHLLCDTSELIPRCALCLRSQFGSKNSTADVTLARARLATCKRRSSCRSSSPTSASSSTSSACLSRCPPFRPPATSNPFPLRSLRRRSGLSSCSRARRRAGCRRTSSSSARRASPACSMRPTGRCRPTTRARTRSSPRRRRPRRQRGRLLLEEMAILQYAAVDAV